MTKPHISKLALPNLLLQSQVLPFDRPARLTKSSLPSTHLKIILPAQRPTCQYGQWCCLPLEAELQGRCTDRLRPLGSAETGVRFIVTFNSNIDCCIIQVISKFSYLHQLVEIFKVLLFINGNFLLLNNNLVALQVKKVEPNPILLCCITPKTNLQDDSIMLHSRLKTNAKSVVTGEVGRLSHLRNDSNILLDHYPVFMISNTCQKQPICARREKLFGNFS